MSLSEKAAHHDELTSYPYSGRLLPLPERTEARRRLWGIETLWLPYLNTLEFRIMKDPLTASASLRLPGVPQQRERLPVLQPGVPVLGKDVAGQVRAGQGYG